jgi:hypothetical protein
VSLRMSFRCERGTWCFRSADTPSPCSTPNQRTPDISLAPRRYSTLLDSDCKEDWNAGTGTKSCTILVADCDEMGFEERTSWTQDAKPERPRAA